MSFRGDNDNFFIRHPQFFKFFNYKIQFCKAILIFLTAKLYPKLHLVTDRVFYNLSYPFQLIN